MVAVSPVGRDIEIKVPAGLDSRAPAGADLTSGFAETFPSGDEEDGHRQPPFFALAWFGSGVDLRGYTPGTYIGKSLAAAQAEWRWRLTEKFRVNFRIDYAWGRDDEVLLVSVGEAFQSRSSDPAFGQRGAGPVQWTAEERRRTMLRRLCWGYSAR